jgi:general secretion pathway protein D
VTVYAPTNTLILTDTGSNVRRLLQLVEELDVAASGEQIWVEPVHHAAASDLAEKLLEIFEAAGAGGAPNKARSSARRAPSKVGTPAAPASSSPATVGTGQSESRLSKIIPDDRTNTLIIVATERAYLRILELIRRLDVPLAGEGEIHVEYLQNADAEELATVIQSITGGARGGGGRRRNQSAGGGSSSSNTAGAATEADVFEGSVQVVADKSTNSLVILSSLRDYTALRAVIQRLDIPRRQVFVEAALLEVSQSRLNTLGISLHGGLPVDVAVDGTTGDPAIGFTGTAYPSGGGLPFSSVAIDPTALTGLAAGLLGPQIEGSEQVIGFSLPAFGVVLQALQTDNDVNVISTPHILATDNVEAQITVGQNVPVQQGFAGLGNAGNQAGGLGGLLPQVNVQRQNVGLTLKLTPHVNESQQVRLELSVELSEVQGAGGINPVISQRTANTQVVVRDQQTIVIGGLVRDVEAQSEDKVPILGDIPVLGYLFRRTQTRREKQNLLIILTPYIIRDASDLRAIFQRKLEERREFIERYTAFTNREPNLHVDYSRTNGLLEEINQAYQEGQHEAQLLRDAAARLPPAHTPSQPIEMPRSAAGNGGEEGGEEMGVGDEAQEVISPDLPPPPTVSEPPEGGSE